MVCLLRRLILSAVIIMLAAVAVFAQVSAQVREMRKLDSIQRLQSFRFRGTESAKPLFPQRITFPTKQNRVSITGRAQATQATVCFDTSGRYFIQEDTMTYYVQASLVLAEGNVLISGQWASRNPPYLTGAFLMKCSDTGSIKWSRLYDSAGHKSYSYFGYYQLLELQDGSFLLAGTTNDLPTDNDDFLLTHTDKNGNIIWSKTYKSRLWGHGSGSADAFIAQPLKQDPSTGDVYIIGPHWSEGNSITRYRMADGTIVWSKYYQLYGANFDAAFGLDILPDQLITFGRFSGYYGGNFTSIFRINKNTGDTISTKFLRTVDNTGFNLGFIHARQLIKLDNGNYAITGRLYRFYYSLNDSISPLYHTGVAEINGKGDFVRAYAFKNNHESNLSNTHITINKDGSGVFSMLRYYTGYTHDVYYVQFKDGQILKQRKKFYLGQGNATETDAIRLPDGSDLAVKLLGDTIDHINKIEFLKLHISDTSSNCTGVDDSTNFSEPYRMEPTTWELATIGSNDFAESRNKTISVRNTTPDYVPACRLISHCDTLSLRASMDTTCVSSQVLLTASKNLECGASVFFDYDSLLVKSLRRLNDSVYQLTFKSPGRAVIYGSIRGCALMRDSVKIAVLNSMGPVNLGPDTVICPGNTIRLTAGRGYASYLWQDGSTDSVFVVRQPGTYHIHTTDSCGNSFYDIVVVSPRAQIPFDIGPDRIICAGDTAAITAPAAFFNYQWWPAYNISSQTIASVKVTPLTDTTYYVSAEKTPGCFVYDSIKVKVHQAPAIDIGPDKSFCKGDSVVLDAGPGFNQYKWSNGSLNRSITVYAAGMYSVKGTTTDNCNSVDTFRVVSVFNLPVPALGNDSVICEGTTRLLDAGNFNQYTWSTGSASRTISVTQTGSYWITVTDNNTCTGTDTLVINKMVTPPAGFLPVDTVICDYGDLTIRPVNNYWSYLWNTGAVGNTITVAAAGTYWLEARDRYGCKGRDSIVLTLKDCLQGFFIPNAFNPASRGRNAFFKPLIFGNLEKYEFAIYNRWAQRVFSSSDIRVGWNGTITGNKQDGGTFVWVCRYKLKNEPAKERKGTVIVIR